MNLKLQLLARFLFAAILFGGGWLLGKGGLAFSFALFFIGSCLSDLFSENIIAAQARQIEYLEEANKFLEKQNQGQKEEIRFLEKANSLYENTLFHLSQKTIPNDKEE